RPPIAPIENAPATLPLVRAQARGAEMNTKRAIAWLIAAAAIVGVAPVTRAEGSADRAALRRQAEAQIARIEERLDAVETDGPLAEMHLAMARRHLEVARKILACGNQSVAGMLAEQAEHLLSGLES